MPKFAVEIAQLVRQTATVIVDAESQEELQNRLGEVYADVDDDRLEWKLDGMWGADEGTHTIIGPTKEDSEADLTLPSN